MMISVDLPDELNSRIEKLVEKSQPPTWPFPYPRVTVRTLSPSDRKKLEAYEVARKKYLAENGSRSLRKNRSAVIRMILNDYFEPKKSATRF